MIKHRGLIKKWTGLMMPEHIQRLKEWEETIEHEYPKEKTDWELEEMQQTIMAAYHKKCPLEFRLWRNDRWIIERGIITAIKPSHKQFIVDAELSVKHIHFHEIQQVTVIYG
ncbi:MAG: YolD-like family protein [Kurthia sp.]|nr:YolD-like family protein [Candidatus Kurthia equi]